ncbi:hypothetical protein [Tateyamaria pelophila]|uniref:hypothetical protein n=1 Tax=Tateyamaria pelophila TaxID=328415 RepID=UPI001CBE5E3C|nr:hypothetical protein [Tateyamaria pelophila]
MKKLLSTIAAVALMAPIVPSFGSMGTVVAVTIPAALATLSGAPVEARGGGRGGVGRGGRGFEGGAHMGGSRYSGNVSVNNHVDRNINRNDNTNVNINRNVDVNVDARHNYGYYDNNDVARAIGAGLVAGVVVTSIANRSDCQNQLIGATTYLLCDGIWYQPQYSGSDVTYLVVDKP